LKDGVIFPKKSRIEVNNAVTSSGSHRSENREAIRPPIPRVLENRQERSIARKKEHLMCVQRSNQIDKFVNGFLKRTALSLCCFLIASQAFGQGAVQKVPGPYFAAKVGAKVRFRQTEQVDYFSPMRTREVTEEVISLTDEQVNVKVTVLEKGKSSTSNAVRQRYIADALGKKMMEEIGPLATTVQLTISGRTWNYEVHERTVEGKDDAPSFTRRVYICRDIPGWTGRIIDNGVTKLELLEYQP
jgi:hypothetical protein